MQTSLSLKISTTAIEAKSQREGECGFDERNVSAEGQCVAMLQDSHLGLRASQVFRPWRINTLPSAIQSV
jgi:hypothetical protein